MYTSTFFAERDAREIRAMIDRYGLAQLVSHDPLKGLQATAVPALFDADDATGRTMIAHMAKANPHWRSIADGDPVLLIFQGPNAYVTPRLYSVEEDVPTWNYGAVQVHGRLRHASAAEENMRILRRTVAHFEDQLGTGWRMDEISQKTVSMYARATAAFAIEVTSIMAAQKMSQDKRRADVEGVVGGLAASGDGQARAVADVMENTTLRRKRYRPEPSEQ